MPNDTEKKENGNASKFLTVTFHSEGNVDVASAGVTVFDLWGLSVYLRVMAPSISDQTDMPSMEKGVSLVYNEDGTVTALQSKMSILDLWAVSNYIKMRADEQYVTVQTAQKMREAAQGKRIEIASSMPGPHGDKR